MRAAMLRIEDEEVPGEAPARAERGVDPLEDAAPVGPGRQVAQRAEGAVHEPGRLVQLEVAHVALAELQLDPRRSCALARLLEHRGRESIPSTGRSVSRATGIATRPLPTASSTSGPSVSRASST